MGARLRSWWQQIEQRRGIIIVLAIILVVAIALIIAGYWLDWTGFNGYNKVTITHTIGGTNAGTVTRTEEFQPGKGLWDWLQLLGVLAIPVVVGFGAAWFTRVQQQRDQRVAREQHDYDQVVAEQRAKSEREAAEKRAQTEREIASDNQHETSLQAYIDKMSELLLHEKLRESAADDELRNVARVRTLTVLPRLDGERKRIVLQFLNESNLIDKDNAIVDISGADLSKVILGLTTLYKTKLSDTKLNEAILAFADLREANLSGADLRRASLVGAHLLGADLSNANLFEADLSYADLSRADLSNAYLKDATNATPNQLANAKSLQFATMPDGSIHP